LVFKKKGLTFLSLVQCKLTTDRTRATATKTTIAIIFNPFRDKLGDPMPETVKQTKLPASSLFRTLGGPEQETHKVGLLVFGYCTSCHGHIKYV